MTSDTRLLRGDRDGSALVAEELQLRSSLTREGGSANTAERAEHTTVRRFQRRRLRDFDYIGQHASHLVTVTAGRQSVLVGDIAAVTMHSLHDARESCRFDVLSFAIMPDHVHILALGLEDTSSLIRFIQRFKQAPGYAYKQRHGAPLWQHSFYDHVLRRDEDYLSVAKYIFDNPVRRGLISTDDDWPYRGGSLVAGEEAPVDSRSVVSQTRDAGAKAPPLRENDAKHYGRTS